MNSRRDGEPHSGAAVAALSCFRYPIECSENSLKVSFRNPAAMVTNRDRCAATVGAGGYLYAASNRLEPDRIAQYVVDGAPDEFQIAVNA